jgi:hypothetical protein
MTSSDQTTITMGDVLKAAWQAVMEDRLEERDRLCDVLKRAWPAGTEAIPMDTPVPPSAWKVPEQ